MPRLEGGKLGLKGPEEGGEVLQRGHVEALPAVADVDMQTAGRGRVDAVVGGETEAGLLRCAVAAAVGREDGRDDLHLHPVAAVSVFHGLRGMERGVGVDVPLGGHGLEVHSSGGREPGGCESGTLPFADHLKGVVKVVVVLFVVGSWDTVDLARIKGLGVSIGGDEEGDEELHLDAECERVRHFGQVRSTYFYYCLSVLFGN